MLHFRRTYREFKDLPILIETETNSRFDGDAVETYLSYQSVFNKKTREYTPGVEEGRDFTLGDNQQNIIQTPLGMLTQSDVDLGVLIFPKDPSGRVQRTGVIKTFSRTKGYLMYMIEALTMKTIRVYDKFSSPNARLSANIIKGECMNELKSFVWPDVDDTNSRYRSSKITGKIGGKNDDNAIAVLMIIFYARIRDAENENVQEWAARTL